MCRQSAYFFWRGEMKLRGSFRALTKFEIFLWLFSVMAVAVSFLIWSEDYLTLIASLIGVTALIFVAKGNVLGQVLTVVFAVFYGIISFWFRYYGEMITYLCMTAPIALLAIFSWIKNPYEKTAEVLVNRLSVKSLLILCGLTAVVTVIFYFLLKALGNASLLVSTFSIATSFFASSLTFMRSPFYALAYAANDLVLIVLWVFAAYEDISCVPMIVCFIMFLANDIYGFYNWRRMKKRQEKSANAG